MLFTIIVHSSPTLRALARSTRGGGRDGRATEAVRGQKRAEGGVVVLHLRGGFRRVGRGCSKCALRVDGRPAAARLALAGGVAMRGAGGGAPGFPPEYARKRAGAGAGASLLGGRWREGWQPEAVDICHVGDGDGYTLRGHRHYAE